MHLAADIRPDPLAELNYYYYYYMIYIAPISRIESEALASLGGEHD